MGGIFPRPRQPPHAKNTNKYRAFDPFDPQDPFMYKSGGPSPFSRNDGREKYGQDYGTSELASSKAEELLVGELQHFERPRNNLVGFAAGIVVPWAVFAFVLGIMSFYVHYEQPIVCYLLVVCVLVGLIFGPLWQFLVNLSRKRRGREELKYEVYSGNILRHSDVRDDLRSDPTWIGFVAIMSIMAWVAGVGLGNYNFHHNMLPYYDVIGMNSYGNVDPRNFIGNRVMDAGRVEFIGTAKVDATKYMAFRNYHTYCVAPITVGSEPQESYDFWAVGKNCCEGSPISGRVSRYQCGEFNNPAAHSGLRLMDEKDRSYFRVAVQQAEAAYNLEAKHPVFFYWIQDPDREVRAYHGGGNQIFITGIIVDAAVQLFLAICALVIFNNFATSSLA